MAGPTVAPAWPDNPPVTPGNSVVCGYQALSGQISFRNLRGRVFRGGQSKTRVCFIAPRKPGQHVTANAFLSLMHVLEELMQRPGVAA